MPRFASSFFENFGPQSSKGVSRECISLSMDDSSDR
jgi:hypothetical protein